MIQLTVLKQLLIGYFRDFHVSGSLQKSF